MDIQRINPREWNCSAAVFGDLVFLSGTVADDKSLDMKGQTAQVLQKIDAVLAKAGTDKSRIVSATVYMADASLKDDMNEAWMAWGDRSYLPTRTPVGASISRVFEVTPWFNASTPQPNHVGLNALAVAPIKAKSVPKSSTPR